MFLERKERKKPERREKRKGGEFDSKFSYNQRASRLEKGWLAWART